LTLPFFSYLSAQKYHETAASEEAAVSWQIKRDTTFIVPRYQQCSQKVTIDGKAKRRAAVPFSKLMPDIQF